ncbi:MAG: class I SAM-dependent DNA methyltransferase [Planctomycetota bacterium]|nr:class I SAM-dependent DNA methyltransferase [Planctomycetota bacterium]
MPIPEDQRVLPLSAGYRADTVEFQFSELRHDIHEFAFIAGYQPHQLQDQDPINLRAVSIMDDLHDALAADGHTGPELERMLVRILFCLFAEDTGIFERDAFRLYLEDRTQPDGSDLGIHLAQLFAVLNTHPAKRQANLDERLASFPYVNGALFGESLGFAAFDRDMRNTLLACTRFNWSQISPAVFGSLFQGIMEPLERRQLGGHYTSERDILKVVQALFLDDLKDEFERAKLGKTQLKQFHQKLSRLRFLDPACGCGNFLVITYRELRLLEIEVLQALDVGRQQRSDIQTLSLVDVDAFYGIEISEWPARIAEVAMWLMDHQMNLRLSKEFGQYLVRLPLTKSPTIVCGNALRLAWKDILPLKECSYVLGNPPFVGKHLMSADQTSDMADVFADLTGAGLLDYVTGWYRKAAEYISGSRTRVAFVSTNSITQGEQVGILWNELFRKWQIKIHFAHRTFAWQSDARGKAHVHVVIIGFGAFDCANKRIYDYGTGGTEVTVSQASNISPYLIECADVAIPIRRIPLCDVPPIVYGNKPADGGFLIIEHEDHDAFVRDNPTAAPYLLPFLCADEYLNGRLRWVLWLVDAPPHVVANNPGVLSRVQSVREFRLASRKEPTRRRADVPALFNELRQPTSEYIVIPRVSSERRKYVPFGYFTPDVIIGDSCTAVSSATLFHFGVLASVMHMAWMRVVCGRLKSDYRYSNKLVYNNYPWPEHTTDAKRKSVEAAARGVLDARSQFLPPKGSSTLAQLYDPLTMPAVLTKSHAALDRAVDRCYRQSPFTSERQRVEFLFALYEKLTAPLIQTPKKRQR